GCSGWLRQEFRELELLDEISRLQYHNTLPTFVQSDQRLSLITSFRRWKGDEYNPKQLHNALRWTSSMSFTASDSFNETNDVVYKQSIGESTDRRTIDKTKNSNKRKRVADEEVLAAKKSKQIAVFIKQQQLQRRGMIWNATTLSFAYDANFTCLYNMWIDNPLSFKSLAGENSFIDTLLIGFHENLTGLMSLEL
ncbi:hypothetical protein M422DRAFT_77879, partial [Sphaerobolus stellatus SS14]